MATTPLRYTTDDDAGRHSKASVGRQALRREVNERSTERDRAEGATSFEVLCECGLARCADRLVVAAETYEGVRRLPTHFLVKPGHSTGEERVLAETALFLVVEKFGHSGMAAVRFDRRRRGVAGTR